MLKYSFVLQAEEKTMTLVGAGNPGRYLITVDTSTHQGVELTPVLPADVVSDGSSEGLVFGADAPVVKQFVELGYLAQLDLHVLHNPGPPETTVTVEQIG